MGWVHDVTGTIFDVVRRALVLRKRVQLHAYVMIRAILIIPVFLILKCVCRCKLYIQAGKVMADCAEDPFEVSDAETMLNYLKQSYQNESASYNQMF